MTFDLLILKRYRELLLLYTNLNYMSSVLDLQASMAHTDGLIILNFDLLL